MKIKLRIEQPEDYQAVENVIRNAFWGQSSETANEHYLAHLLRKSPDFIPELDYVAEFNGEIIGSIMFSKACIISTDGNSKQVLTFGPLAVAPEYKNHGVGKKLVRHTLDKAKLLGYAAVVIFGEPDYYPKLGFLPAEKFGITTSEGKNIDAFLCYPLKELKKDFAGKFYESTVFESDLSAIADFDKRFPQKKPQKMIMVTELPLSEQTKNTLTQQKINKLSDLHFHSARELKLLISNVEELRLIDEVLAENGYPQRFNE